MFTSTEYFNMNAIHTWLSSHSTYSLSTITNEKNMHVTETTVLSNGCVIALY